MKINQDEDHGIKTFEELKVFDTFRWCGAFYMKTKKVGFLNAVRLSDGDIHGFDEFETVRHLKTTLIIQVKE